MTPAKQTCNTDEQEFRVVIHAFQSWRCCWEGSDVQVVTDHHPNTSQTQVTLSRRQTRWYEWLQTFNFTWEYRPGRTHVADPLSRHPAFLAVVRVSVLQIRGGRIKRIWSALEATPGLMAPRVGSFQKRPPQSQMTTPGLMAPRVGSRKWLNPLLYWTLLSRSLNLAEGV